MISVVVFQYCMGCVEGETGSCNKTCVMFVVDGNEEISIKGEELNIKDEIPEDIIFPSIKTENDVRLQWMCDVVAAHACRLFLTHTHTHKKTGITLNCSLLCVILWVPYTFEIWNEILKRRDFWKS